MRILPVLLTVTIGLSSGPAPAFAGESSSTAPKAMALASKRTDKESRLKKGMSAEEVRRIMGRPTETQPMEAPSGKAEIWVYRTRQELSRERFETGSRPITTLVRDSNGNERTQIIGHEPIYGMQKRVLVRSYQVLMFNDHMLNEKLQLEEVRETE